ncbi:MAG: alpha/beta fold hydrolase [Allosphingosinicella sp.]|uniref:alpha/beta hydrolase family protein n=1 Tax=Allosphingosinicella sp. TaxID=2823234 RepID=UPI003926F1F3
MTKMMLHAAAAAAAIAAPQVAGAVTEQAQVTKQAPVQAFDPAAAFGARESVQAIAMSPDGRHLAFAQPTAGQGAALYVVDLEGGQPRAAVTANGTDQRLGGCEFVSNQRLVCTIWAVATYEGMLVPVSRLIAMNADGSNIRVLGERDSFNQHYVRTFSGSVIDWLPGQDDSLLMTQTFIPDTVTGSRVGRREEGLGVVRMDTSNLRTRTAESPRADAVRYIADGRGTVRMMATRGFNDATGQDSPILTYFYRTAGSRDWREFSTFDERDDSGLRPVAVDPDLNAAYAFGRHNGRTALFRVKLDGSMQRELVASHDAVDVDGLIRVGRRNRVVGASFATDKRQAIYFDPELQALAERLNRALPNLPLIHFADASEDEQRLLIWAGSDTDPGRYYTYDKGTRQLNEIMLARPQLENVALAPVRAVTYSAADGTQIPAYLTLPPGSSGRGLPAIVMPHGGPSARDVWGFDWLAQYFANRGYAVLQPNFRGSAGYGEAWFQRNGFVSWRTAIGDINDAGRWLASEGIADPAKLAIVGWSYGGYAALQSNVVDPSLFKAVVAIAPVTDLNMARNEWRGFSNAANVRDFFGSGPHIREGSPLQNVAAIRAPVLMFHGDLDRNVGIAQARAMDQRLRGAGRRSELVTFTGLDHQIDDSRARAEMLGRTDAFLREELGIR